MQQVEVHAGETVRQPGTRLGPYEIVIPLGGGGTGEVYRARDTRLSAKLALEIVRCQPGLQDAGDRVVNK